MGLLSLQRSAGNRAVAELLASRPTGTAGARPAPLDWQAMPSGIDVKDRTVPTQAGKAAAAIPTVSSNERPAADVQKPGGTAGGRLEAKSSPPSSSKSAPNGAMPSVLEEVAAAQTTVLPSLKRIEADLKNAAAAAAQGPETGSSPYHVDEGGEELADDAAVASGAKKPDRGKGTGKGIAKGTAFDVTAKAATALDAMQSEAGEPVPKAKRKSAEKATGKDLKRARLHKGPLAAEAAEAISAKAFSVGDHIGVGAEVDTASAEGEALVAHELGHMAHAGEGGSGLAGGGEEAAAATESAPVAGGAPAETGPAPPPWPFTPGPNRAEIAARRGTVVRRAAINAEADNLGTLSKMFDAAAQGAREAVAGATQEGAQKVGGSLDTATGKATGALATTQGTVSEAFAGQQEAVRSGFATANTDVTTKTDEVVTGVDSAASAAVEGVNASGATGAAQVEGELNARAGAVEAQGNLAEFTQDAGKQKGAIDSAASQIIGEYSGHEKITDIRAGVRSIADTAKGDIDKAVETARSETQSAAKEIADQPRAAIPEQRGHVESTTATAVAKTDEQRAEAQQGLADVKAQATGGLADAEVEAMGKLDAARQESQANLAAVQSDAMAALGQARSSSLEAYDAFGQKATTQVDGWLQAAQGEQAAVQSEVGNLFCPEDIQPVLEDLAKDAGGDKEALARGTGGLTGAHTSGVRSFVDALGRAAGLTNESLTEVVSGGLSSVSNAVGQLGGALTGSLSQFAPGFTSIVTEVGSVIDRLFGTVCSAGKQGEAQVAGGMQDATKDSRAEIGKIVASAKTEMRESAAENGDTDSSWSVWDSILGALEWIGKNLLNLLWGFVWGDPLFEDVSGASIFAFVGDVIAGIFIVGDIRDILKWGIIKPLIFGEGYSWENALMIGLAIVGIIPFVGDAVKIAGKGGKLLVRTSIKALKKKLGEELTEKLVKELGEGGAKELGDKLSKDAIEKMLKAFTPTDLQKLTKELGPEAVERLAKEISAEAVKEIIEKVGTKGLKDLLEAFSPTAIKKMSEEYPLDTLKTISESATEFAEVMADLGFDQVKKLLKGEVKVARLLRLRKSLGKHFSEVTQQLSPNQLIDLDTLVTAKVANAVLDGVGTKGLREVMEGLGGSTLDRLGSSGVLSATQILDLAKLGKEVVDKYPPKLLARVANLIAGDKIKAAVLKRILSNIPASAAEETVENLLKDPTGKLIRCYEDLGVELTNNLIGAMGAHDLASAAGDVGTDGILQMLRKCESPAQFARLCEKLGAKVLKEKLAKVSHANELEGRTPPEPEPNMTPAEPEAGPEPNFTPSEPQPAPVPQPQPTPTPSEPEPEPNFTPSEPEPNFTPAEREEELVPG